MPEYLRKTVQPPPGPRGQTPWSPYAAGFGIGVTLLLAYGLLGTGLGASGGLARVAAWLLQQVAPNHVAASAYFGGWLAEGGGFLGYYLVIMALGIFLGGLLSAIGAGRMRLQVERGEGASRGMRLWFSLGGGVLVGFAARLARGCTSGQALSGTAMLFTGSVLFLLAMFAGGYLTAYWVRRQWS